MGVKDESEKTVREKIERALKKLLKFDSQLLSFDVNERSITHRLAIYLEDEFPEYHVDCEYNRDVKDPKRINKIKEKANMTENPNDPIADTNAVSVYPDIIVHRRGKNDNFLVIEVKKTKNRNQSEEEEKDKAKLRAYIEIFKYVYAFFIKVPVGNDINKSEYKDVFDWIERLKKKRGESQR